MTLHFNRRALFQLGAAATLTLAAPNARADDTPVATPATPRPSIETYAASPGIDQIALSPDGTRCAFITQKGDEKFLANFRIDDQDGLKGASIGPAKIRDLFFVDNSRVILVNSVTTALREFVGYRNEFLLARMIDLDTYDVNILFSHEDYFYGMVRGDLQRVKVEGEYRVTASNYRMNGDYPLSLYSFGTKSARGHMMDEQNQNTRSWVIGPDAHIHGYDDFDEKTKEWRLYFNTNPPGKSPHYEMIYKVKEALSYPDLVGLGRDGQSLLLKIYAGETAGEYHEIKADGSLSEALDPDGEDRQREPLFHPVTQRLAGFKHHDDWFTTDYYDPLLKKVSDGLKATMGEDYRYRVVDWAEDVRKMIVYGENAQDAGTYYFVDFTNGGIQLLAQNYTRLPEEWITEKTAIKYAAGDGTTIHGYLTLPPFKSPKALPLVVLPHGGPAARDDIGFDWQTQVLAAYGYAVLQPNFRGSTGYGEDFTAKGYGEWGRKMQTDLSDGVRWLAAQGTIDPKRVAILGASYGGYAAMAGATLDPGVYRCAVAIAGVSDLESFIDFQEANSVTSKSSRVLYWKTQLGDPKTYDAASPAKQAAKAYCPILLIHGSDDTVVPIDQSKRMEKALKAAGKPVEFVTYKGQDHWETVGSARIEMMKQALAFLDRYNPAG
ncbi:MAG: S9 family peptidase [Asticcacaulis sp.]|nr:S9 family peptidase [Asticcacaulis sp.]